MRGFTLVELMITVVIISILAAIAFPNYSAYVERARRADGKEGLLRAAQWLERAATSTGTYPTVAIFNASGFITSEGGKYNIVYALVAGGGYNLTATPVIADTGCDELTLNHTGTRGKTGTLSASDCWNR